MGVHMGAGIIIVKKVDDDYRVLALQASPKIRAANGGGFDIPKGRKDPHESNWQCAIRETFEETSMVINKSHVLAGPFSEDWLTVWLCEFSNHDPILWKNPETGLQEHLHWEWMPFDEMEIYCYPYLKPYVRWAHKIIKGL